MERNLKISQKLTGKTSFSFDSDEMNAQKSQTEPKKLLSAFDPMIRCFLQSQIWPRKWKFIYATGFPSSAYFYISRINVLPTPGTPHWSGVLRLHTPSVPTNQDFQHGAGLKWFLLNGFPSWYALNSGLCSISGIIWVLIFVLGKWINTQGSASPLGIKYRLCSGVGIRSDTALFPTGMKWK